MDSLISRPRRKELGRVPRTSGTGLQELEKWIRRRLRCYLWKQWGRQGYRELKRRGMSVGNECGPGDSTDRTAVYVIRRHGGVGGGASWALDRPSNPGRHTMLVEAQATINGSKAAV